MFLYTSKVERDGTGTSLLSSVPSNCLFSTAGRESPTKPNAGIIYFADLSSWSAASPITHFEYIEMMFSRCCCFGGLLFCFVVAGWFFFLTVINQFLNQAKVVLIYQEEKVACRILKITVIERLEKLLIMSPIIVSNHQKLL